jgi:hypothetical protein
MERSTTAQLPAHAGGGGGAPAGYVLSSIRLFLLIALGLSEKTNNFLKIILFNFFSLVGGIFQSQFFSCNFSKKFKGKVQMLYQAPILYRGPTYRSHLNIREPVRG